WRALPEFRGEARFATWLHRIVARLALARIEGLARRRAREGGLDAAAHVAEPERAASDGRLDSRDARVSPGPQSVGDVFDGADRGVARVAGLLERQENTVKQHLSRGGAAVRAWWRVEGDEA